MKKKIIAGILGVSMLFATEAFADTMPEKEAFEAAEAGTLESDGKTGYEYSDETEQWYYSNYPNYKDFNEDGKIKIAFVCKFSGSWFTPKSDAMAEKCKEYGYEYTFIDANQDEQTWLDGIQNIINQDYDIAILCAVNSTLYPQAIEMLQDAGIAYMTTDDPGKDADGFNIPHYGLDDYALMNQTGTAMAEEMEKDDFMEGVKDDYSNMMFILEDSPDVEALHKRNTGVYDAIKAKYPDIPDSQIVWLDCGSGLEDEIAAKLSSTIQANKDSVDKWVVASPSAGLAVTMTLFKEAGVDISANVRMAECIGMASQAEVMLENEDVADATFGAMLVSRPAGTNIIETVHNLVEDATPFPAFTGYDLLLTTGDNIAELYDTYFAE